MKNISSRAFVCRTISLAGLLTMLFFQVALAQFPVQINTQLRPPYTLQLSDYYASSREKIVVILTNRDLNKPVLNVRLQMSIESQTVKIRTRAYADLPVITLDAGVPLRLSLNDLEPYFNPENLDFSGIARQQYVQQPRLPEGFYQFCFEAVEVSSGQLASGKGCASAWISLSDPPMLNIPSNREAIAFKPAQNIIFQWTPRHLNSPNTAFQTEYDFQLVELWDTSLAPEVVFQSSAPLYETTIRTTTLLYGPSQPLLIVGKRYGWRVRARAVTGIDNVDVFRNQGYSEIYAFTYQDSCPAVKNLTGNPGVFGNLEFNWLSETNHKSFVLNYRQKGKDENTWFDQKIEQSSALVYDVQPGLTYEFRVGAFCASDQPTFSDIYTIEMPARSTETFVNCSIVPDADITNKEPIAALKAGDVFRAGDFPVKIQELSGSGTYTGKGYVMVPFLGKAKVSVKLEDIQVNTQSQLFSGQVVTNFSTGKTNAIVDVDELQDIFKGYQGLVSRVQALTIRTDAESIKKLTEKVIEEAKNELPSEEASAVVENITKVTEAKKEYDQASTDYAAATTPEEKNAAKEKIANAEKKFEEAKSKFEGQVPNAITTAPYIVDFALADNSNFGLDKIKYRPAHEINYASVQRGSEKYFVSWKAVEEGVVDWVKAYSTTKDQPLPKDIFARSSTGAMEVQPGKDAQEINVKVYGYKAGEKNEIILYRKQSDKATSSAIEVGRLNVVSYKKIKHKLIIVPVNGGGTDIAAQDVQQSLRKIYGPAVVEWSVERSEPVTVSYDVNGTEGLEDGESELLSNYTSEMQRFLLQYEQQRAFEKDVYYLFLIPRSETGDKRGYMPLQSKAGFIFMDRASGSLLKTIAHELGHGAFNLEHTYKAYPQLSEGSTDNLMDIKSDGVTLCKYQWDLIHNPAFTIPLFNKDEGAMLTYIEEQLAKQYLTMFYENIKASVRAELRGYATSTYQVADWLSEKISLATIPEPWWNCDNVERNGIQKTDKLYFKQPIVLTALGKVLSPTDKLVNEFIKKMLPEDSKIYQVLNNADPELIKIALGSGVWDGAVGLVGALPGGVKLATMNFADDPKAKENVEKFSKLLEQGDGVIGTGKIIFGMIISQFDPNKPCVMAHSVGQVGFDVVVAVFTGGTGAVASRSGSTIKEVMILLNKLDVVGNTIGKVSGTALKVAFKGSSKILIITVQNGKKFIEASMDKGKYVLRSFKQSTKDTSPLEWNAAPNVKIEGTDAALPVIAEAGKKLDENVPHKLEPIVDENGELIVTANDEVLVKVENTVTHQQQIVVVKDAGQKIIRNVPGGLLAYANIRKYLGDGQIKAYLNNSMLKTFEDILRKGDPDVLKQLDNMNVEDFGEVVRGYVDNPKAFENSIASVDKFSGQYGWLNYWKLTPQLKESFQIIADLRNQNKLMDVGNATEIQLSTLHAFTVKGDFLNIPLRYNKSYLGEYADRGIKHVKACLDELRKLPGRRVFNERVYSGKAYSKAEFEKELVGGNGKEVALKGFVSTSKKESVAEGFVEASIGWAGTGPKVAVIRRITSKEGVYVDDLSDWGKNLGPARHANANPPSIRIQEEVLLNEGYFKQMSEPIPVMENGVQKVIQGMPVYYVDFVEMVKPL